MSVRNTIKILRAATYNIKPTKLLSSSDILMQPLSMQTFRRYASEIKKPGKEIQRMNCDGRIVKPVCPPCPCKTRPPCRMRHIKRYMLTVKCCPPGVGCRPPCKVRRKCVVMNCQNRLPGQRKTSACFPGDKLNKRCFHSDCSEAESNKTRVAKRLTSERAARQREYETEVELAKCQRAVASPGRADAGYIAQCEQLLRAQCDERDFNSEECGRHRRDETPSNPIRDNSYSIKTVSDQQHVLNPGLCDGRPRPGRCGADRTPPPPVRHELKENQNYDKCKIPRGHVDPCAHMPPVVVSIERPNRGQEKRECACADRQSANADKDGANTIMQRPNHENVTKDMKDTTIPRCKATFQQNINSNRADQGHATKAGTCPKTCVLECGPRDVPDRDSGDKIGGCRHCFKGTQTNKNDVTDQQNALNSGTYDEKPALGQSSVDKCSRYRQRRDQSQSKPTGDSCSNIENVTDQRNVFKPGNDPDNRNATIRDSGSNINDQPKVPNPSLGDEKCVNDSCSDTANANNPQIVPNPGLCGGKPALGQSCSGNGQNYDDGKNPQATDAQKPSGECNRVEICKKNATSDKDAKEGAMTKCMAMVMDKLGGSKSEDATRNHRDGIIKSVIKSYKQATCPKTCRPACGPCQDPDLNPGDKKWCSKLPARVPCAESACCREPTFCEKLRHRRECGLVDPKDLPPPGRESDCPASTYNPCPRQHREPCGTSKRKFHTGSPRAGLDKAKDGEVKLKEALTKASVLISQHGERPREFTGKIRIGMPEPNCKNADKLLINMEFHNDLFKFKDHVKGKPEAPANATADNEVPPSCMIINKAQSSPNISVQKAANVKTSKPKCVAEKNCAERWTISRYPPNPCSAKASSKGTQTGNPPPSTAKPPKRPKAPRSTKDPRKPRPRSAPPNLPRCVKMPGTGKSTCEPNAASASKPGAKKSGSSESIKELCKQLNEVNNKIKSKSYTSISSGAKKTIKFTNSTKPQLAAKGKPSTEYVPDNLRAPKQTSKPKIPGCDKLQPNVRQSKSESWTSKNKTKKCALDSIREIWKKKTDVLCPKKSSLPKLPPSSSCPPKADTKPAVPKPGEPSLSCNVTPTKGPMGSKPKPDSSKPKKSDATRSGNSKPKKLKFSTSSVLDHVRFPRIYNAYDEVESQLSVDKRYNISEINKTLEMQVIYERDMMNIKDYNADDGMEFSIVKPRSEWIKYMIAKLRNLFK